MSTNTKIVTISETNRKTLKSHSAESVVSRYIHLPDDENFKPSDCKVGLDLAKTGLGMVFTADSFAQGLVSLAAMHSWGQKTYAQITDKLPPLSVIAFDHAASFLKRGAGCTSLQLKGAVIAAIEHCIALPKRDKTVKAIDAKPAIEGASTVVSDIADCKPIMPYLKLVNGKIARTLASVETARLAAETAALAEKAALEIHADAPDFVDLFANLFNDQPDQAIERLNAMATIAGFKLVKVKAKAA